MTDDLLAITPEVDPSPFKVDSSEPSQVEHYSVHTDHLGSVRAITNLAGQVVNSYAMMLMAMPRRALKRSANASVIRAASGMLRPASIITAPALTIRILAASCRKTRLGLRPVT
jgi:hypothetical protein